MLVGYFPQWAFYDPQPFYVKTLVDNRSAARLSQINFANASVQNGRCSLSDPNADLNITYTRRNSVNGRPDNPASPFRGYFHQLHELKRRYPRLKILMSLEGKAEDFAQDAKPENRRAFVASCVDTFVNGHFAGGIRKPGIFDGFDIDWESPQEQDAANFRALLEEFRRQMSAVRPGLQLAVAVGQAPEMLPGTDFGAIGRIVDQVGIMNYDYAGPWSPTTGLLAPLLLNPAAPHQSSSIEHSIASYKAAGVPRSKILLGLPFYGYSWTGVDSANNGLFQAGRAVHADKPYHYIRDLAAQFSAYRDQRSQAPWLFDGETFWTYEDPVSARYKASYASYQHLGGMMIWELSGDTADAELLNTVFRSLRHPLNARVFAQTRSVDLKPPNTAPSQNEPADEGVSTPSAASD